MTAEVVTSVPIIELQYPLQVSPPLTILVEDIHDPVDGHHQHIDIIYVCRLVDRSRPLHDGWLWVSKKTLVDGTPMDRGCGSPVPPPEDVRLLTLHAFQVVEGSRTIR